MSTALAEFLQNTNSRNLESIEQKFSEPGHGNVQEVDTVHSVIERHIRHREIYSPITLIRTLRALPSSFKTKLTLVQMMKDDFFDYKAAAGKLFTTDIPYFKVKLLKYTKNEPFVISYKLGFNSILVRKDMRGVTRSGRKIGFPEIILIKGNATKISKEKVADIKSMMPFMPEVDKAFFNAIFTTETSTS